MGKTFDEMPIPLSAAGEGSTGLQVQVDSMTVKGQFNVSWVGNLANI